jgi:DNA-damage-inducible protein J
MACLLILLCLPLKSTLQQIQIGQPAGQGLSGTILRLRYNVSQGELAMATTEMVHVRVDKRIKARAAKALASMGLSVSDAVRVLLTRVAAEKALPFEVKVPNTAAVAAMREARKGGLRSFSKVDGLMADLNAED